VSSMASSRTADSVQRQVATPVGARWRNRFGFPVSGSSQSAIVAIASGTVAPDSGMPTGSSLVTNSGRARLQEGRAFTVSPPTPVASSRSPTAVSVISDIVFGILCSGSRRPSRSRIDPTEQSDRE